MNKPAVQHAAARPIGAQIDAANVRLANANKAEEGLQELGTAARKAIASELPREDRRKPSTREAEAGVWCRPRQLVLDVEQILELVETKWPATQDAPTVGGMIHQARAVLEKFTSRSPDPQHTRSMTTPTNMQAETHGADDDLDLDMEGPFTPSSAREKVVQGCGSTIAEHGAQNVPRRKWKAAGTQRVGTTDKIRAAHLEGGRRTSALQDGTCSCGKEFFRRTRKTSTTLTEPPTPTPRPDTGRV